MSRIIAITVLSMGLSACMSADIEESPSAAPADQTMTTISVSEMQAQSADGRVLLDLQRSDIEYRVEGEVNLDAVDVACPSGQIMNLGSWVQDIERAGAQVRAGEEFTMFSSGRAGDVGTESPPPCSSPCYLHLEPDRTWVCFGSSECGGTAVRAEDIQPEAKPLCPQWCTSLASCDDDCDCGYANGVYHGECYINPGHRYDHQCLCY